MGFAATTADEPAALSDIQPFCSLCQRSCSGRVLKPLVQLDTENMPLECGSVLIPMDALDVVQTPSVEGRRLLCHL